jgi:hypothetical protein
MRVSRFFSRNFPFWREASGMAAALLAITYAVQPSTEEKIERCVTIGHQQSRDLITRWVLKVLDALDPGPTERVKASLQGAAVEVSFPFMMRFLNHDVYDYWVQDSQVYRVCLNGQDCGAGMKLGHLVFARAPHRDYFIATNLDKETPESKLPDIERQSLRLVANCARRVLAPGS